MGTIFVSNLGQFGKLPLGSFLKAFVKNAREIPENAEKELQATTAHSWSLHEIMRRQPNPMFPQLWHYIIICLSNKVRMMRLHEEGLQNYKSQLFREKNEFDFR